MRLIHTLGLYWLFYRLTLSLSRKKKKNSPCTAPPINNTARCERDQQQQQQRRIERNGQKNKSFFFPTALAYTFITIINIAFFFLRLVLFVPSSTAIINGSPGEIVSLCTRISSRELMRNISFRTHACV